ncbi:MAG: glycoside hydrolase family 65 [Firmicutes bacterium]|nr:glycoside hydrolase family 65 [Bacillota bacterium]
MDRQALVRRHNPVLRNIDPASPLTVGNGEFAFTADITGLQTLYAAYETFPLCTMSQWGWHTRPGPGGRLYTLGDVEMTRYAYEGRTFAYATQCRRGNEEIYRWLRHNPHRLNLARIALSWDGGEIRQQDISNVRQELDLFTGALHSEFTLFGTRVRVCTVCARSADVLGFAVHSAALAEGRLTVRVSFAYGSHRKAASDWQSGRGRTTAESHGDSFLLKRELDADAYSVFLTGGKFAREGAHSFVLAADGPELTVTAAFSRHGRPETGLNFAKVREDSAEGWARFWLAGGMVDFSGARDPRAAELERRTVLSQYLTAAQCAGSLPPQETGLSLNSWYGKFHLEMHILHAGWFPLWGRSESLEKSFAWYQNTLESARANAARNGFRGARWPKMAGPEGADSPSRIATLLLWQQPHILYMLELARQAMPETRRPGFMLAHWELVRETADFMCDFVRPNRRTGQYDLPPPLIPAQEEHAPETVLNPAFELCYWRFGLELAIRWAAALCEETAPWRAVLSRLNDPPVLNGLYAAHQNCPDTFTRFARDHPSMLYGYGFIPCGRVDKRIMSDTADRVLACWNWDTAWGWDFPLTAMTLTRLGRPEAAVDILLKDAAKNSYVVSGNNFQQGRDDLPLYLPGNGSLLLALSMMLAGYGDTRGAPGFPQNGMWDDIDCEGILPLPY